MIISYNNYTAKIRDFDGKKAISLRDLVSLSGQVGIYQKLQKNFKYNKYIKRNNKKDTCLTLDGCIEILSDYREPNDGLINEIKKIKDSFDVKRTEFKKKIPAESFVDIELARIEDSKEKKDSINKLEERIGLLENVMNNLSDNIPIDLNIIKDSVENVDDRLSNVEDNLSYINDKLNQQDTSFRALLKECIKEIIREELKQDE